MNRIVLLAVLASLTTTALACSPSDAVVSGDEADVTASARITIANYKGHPRIKSIRDLVAEIDRFASLEVEKAVLCDGVLTKHTDTTSGQIRKVVSEGGEGGAGGSETAYYDESGKLRFVFASEWSTDPDRASELRVYFDEAGKVLFQALREGTLDANGKPAAMGADRAPTDAERYSDDRVAHASDPATWVLETGCGEVPPAPSCGGFAGFTCGKDSFCSYLGDAQCGRANQTGTCEPIPTLCPRDVDLVCGCDGETYNNACNANARGTSVAHKGACN